MPGFEVIGDEERAEILSIFDGGGVLFRHGFEAQRQGIYKVRDFEQAFAKEMRAPSALAVASGTAALRVALATLGIGRGDSVVLPAFTFVATAEAVIESGATPICCEVDATLNMCPIDLARSIRSDTRAVIAVHMLGVPARLNEILSTCNSHGVDLIEDTAWGCGGALDGRFLGTWGRIGTYSFDFAKTMTTGEGGMLVFQDASDANSAAAWHDHGHENNPSVPRWEDTRHSSGFNYRMSELQGAVGLAQLAKLSRVVQAQRRHHAQLAEALSDIDGLSLRVMPKGSEPTYDALVFSVSSPELARECRKRLIACGVGTKILPEAVSWHFAGTWNHMPALAASHPDGLERAFPKTRDLLSRSVAIGTSVRDSGDQPVRVFEAITAALA